jgi:hypothetical protein
MLMAAPTLMGLAQRRCRHTEHHGQHQSGRNPNSVALACVSHILLFCFKRGKLPWASKKRPWIDSTALLRSSRGGRLGLPTAHRLLTGYERGRQTSVKKKAKKAKKISVCPFFLDPCLFIPPKHLSLIDLACKNKKAPKSRFFSGIPLHRTGSTDSQFCPSCI